MNTFVKKLTIFVLPILFLAICGEYLVRRIPNDYSQKQTYLDNHADDINVLFLGNSHIYYGINPEYIRNKSYNAAYISQSIDYDLAILELYKDHWKELKYIIIPIDYFSLDSKLGTSVEAWRVKNYTIYYNIDIDQKSVKNNSEMLSSNLKINSEKLNNFYLKKESAITSNKFGWGTSYNSGKNKDLDRTGMTAALRHTVKDDDTHKNNLRILKNIIQFGKQRNIKIILITCPTYKTYYDNLNLNQLHNTITAVTDIAKKNNVDYYNWLKDKSFDKSDFYDADHLNEIGAKKLTMKIDSLIQKPH
ncbi:hypothetical protein EZJ43_00940 [Pedobacter changchengzhani]|uniref:SGNH/GDSL hydrolase family protein n=1 Tax=Pedobacter changchengzhani TaxID=2529274 RepID=A0A4R5MPG7_9SPHI|nr:hypothetical protein [Pedobacter changchengzhani]TDG37691.1 hypothetical protein EZJ43_00940 [Pedobacter changchengzhani]